MSYVVRVHVISGDRACGVVEKTGRALIGACACAGSVKYDEVCPSSLCLWPRGQNKTCENNQQQNGDAFHDCPPRNESRLELTVRSEIRQSPQGVLRLNGRELLFGEARLINETRMSASCQ